MQRMSFWNATRRAIETVRRSIDGGEREALDEALENAKPSRLREREQVIKRIALAVADRLEREAVTMPGKSLLVPPLVVVYLDSDENVRWVNQARRWLIEGLNEATAQRVRAMPGFDSARTQIPRVDLREDPQLELRGVRIEPEWGPAKDDEVTVERINPQITTTYVEPAEGEPTIVVDSSLTLYKLEVWKAGLGYAHIPVSAKHATIGRGAPARPVDVLLPDPNVSRLHAALDVERDGYWITSLGRNRLRVGGRTLELRHRVKVIPGEPIEICNFTLRIA